MDECELNWKPSSVRCPYCESAVMSRRAKPLKPLYEDSKGDVWGEAGVLTFDYEAHKANMVHKSIRKEWFVEGEEIFDVCECVFRATHREKCEEMCIPSGLSRKSFNNFEVCRENEKAYRVCAEFSLSFSRETARGIGIYGPTGVGKTHLALAVTNQIIMDRIRHGDECSAGFFSVPKLLQELRWWSIDGAVDEERNFFRKLEEKEIIVLDDLGVDRLNDRQREQLFLIVDSRIINEKPIIATTNMDPCVLDHVVGERVADRLREACNWHRIDGISHRGRNL